MARNNLGNEIWQLTETHLEGRYCTVRVTLRDLGGEPYLYNYTLHSHGHHLI